jgi:hypothetical protein
LLAQRLLDNRYNNSNADIMYLGPAFLFAAFASLFYVPGFLDTPLGMLTPRQLVSQLLFAVFALISLAALARSIEFDPVWPWRPEFRRAMNWLLGRTQ